MDPYVDDDTGDTSFTETYTVNDKPSTDAAFSFISRTASRTFNIVSLDNAHALSAENPYTIKLSVTDADACGSGTPKTTVFQFQLTVKPFNHAPVLDPMPTVNSMSTGSPLPVAVTTEVGTPASITVPDCNDADTTDVLTIRLEY